MTRARALIRGGSDDAESVVDVRGEVDVETAPVLRDWLVRASRGRRRSIVVDLRGVPFLAIDGVYVLCDEQHRMARHHARLTVVCSDPRALQLLSVCRLEDVLHVVPAPAAAAERPWSADDDDRAARLDDWRERYSAESA